MIYDMVIGNRIEVADAMKLRQPAGDDRSGGKSAESVVQAWVTDGDGENISATVCGHPRRCAIRRSIYSRPADASAGLLFLALLFLERKSKQKEL